MSAPPILVTTDGVVAASTVLFRYRGQLSAAVVVKATFAIDPSGALETSTAELATGERTYESSPTRSVELSSDLAPYKARCDVTLVGHAYPPGGRPATHASTRLAIVRDDGSRPLDKTLQVSERQPFERVPIVYERAVGGPGEANPYGTEAPTIVDVADAKRPGGYGPISRFSPPRKQLVRGVDRQALEGALLELPETIAWDYFQSAPRDQQIDYPRGGEWLVLDGVHPTLPRVQLRLPAARGAARVFAHGAPGRPIDLVCDTVAIDADRMRLSMVWRGRHVVDAASTAPVTIASGLERPGVAIDWPRIAAASPTAPLAPPPRGVPVGEGTMSVDERAVADLLKGPATPFASGPSSASGPPSLRSPLSTNATPWAAAQAAAPHVSVRRAHLGATIDASRPEEVGEATFALKPREHDAAAHRQIAPFAVAGPTPTRERGAAAPAIGLPFGGGSPPSERAVPASAVGEETMAIRGAAPFAPPPSTRAPAAPPQRPNLAPPPPPSAPAPHASPPSAPPLARPPSAHSLQPPQSAPVLQPQPPSSRPPYTPSASAPPLRTPPLSAAPQPQPRPPAAPVTSPPAAKPAPPAPKPASLADSLKAAGASAGDLSSLMSALAGPPPPPPPEDND